MQKGGSVPSNGDGYHRSVCLEEFTYNADGQFPTIPPTTDGPEAIADLNPYAQTEAETIAWESGVQTEATSDTGGGMDVTNIQSGDYIKVKSVDFGPGAISFAARVASSASGGQIELRLDSLTSTPVATCAVKGTGGNQKGATVSGCAVAGATGVHDLYLEFTGGGGDLFNLNWWQFTSSEPADSGVSGGESSSTRSSGSQASGSGSQSTASGSASGGGSGSSSGATSGSRSATATPEASASSAGTSNGAAAAGSSAGCSCRLAPGESGDVRVLLGLPPLGAAVRLRRRSGRRNRPVEAKSRV